QALLGSNGRRGRGLFFDEPATAGAAAEARPEALQIGRQQRLHVRGRIARGVKRSNGRLGVALLRGAGRRGGLGRRGRGGSGGGGGGPRVGGGGARGRLGGRPHPPPPEAAPRGGWVDRRLGWMHWDWKRTQTSEPPLVGIPTSWEEGIPIVV